MWTNIEVNRLYACTECEAEILVKQVVTEDFHKRCPCCNTDGLWIKDANSNIGIAVDTKTCKTLGSLAEKNRQERIKNGTLDEQKKYKPWWRKSEKVNFDILKNPKKYIEKGSA